MTGALKYWPVVEGNDVGFGGGKCHSKGEDGKGLVQHITSGRVTGEDVGGLRGCRIKLWLPSHEHPGSLYLPTHKTPSG